MPRLWLINQFANTPDLPGHTRQYEVAAALVQRGWSVEVFASDFNLTQRSYRRLSLFQLSKLEVVSGIRWHWLLVSPYRYNDWKRHVNMFTFAVHIGIRLFLSALHGTIFRRRPDIILASSPQLPAAFVAMFVSRLFRIPFVLEVRDLWPQVLIDLGNKAPYSPLVLVLRWMETQLYAYAKLVIVLAKGAIQYVNERGSSQVSWLPNGPDLEIFYPRPLPVASKVFTILYAGAHGQANGLDNVIKAASLLEGSDPHIRFRFIGDGPEKKSLVQMSRHLASVTFEDPVPKTHIPSIMAEADAILLSLGDVPLFSYGVSPNKLYDAYALGRPVITTVPGSINKEVEDHSLGFTAMPGNPEDLASAILRLARTPHSGRALMARRGTELAQSTYSRQRICSQYDTLLRQLL